MRGAYVRVVIWVDMEGIAGIEVWEQVTGGSPQYEEGRRLMTGEVNAAVRGAKAAGADDIIVIDCHGAGGGYSFNEVLSVLCAPIAAKSRYTSPPRATRKSQEVPSSRGSFRLKTSTLAPRYLRIPSLPST